MATDGPLIINSGYDWQNENHEGLRELCQPFPRACMTADPANELTYDRWPVPDRRENQGRYPSCAGNATSSAVEKVFWQLTGKIEQLSRYWAWTRAQQLDGGNVSVNRGATIYNSVRAAMEGIPPESLVPYPVFPDMPSTRWSKAVLDAGKPFAIKSVVKIESYEHARAFCGTGAGFLLWGMWWPPRMRDNWIVEDVPDISGGGMHGAHALCGGFLHSGLRDGRKYPYLMAENSWDRSWGRDGLFVLSPFAIDKICRQQFGVYGLSDMEVPGPRNVDFTKTKPFTR